MKKRQASSVGLKDVYGVEFKEFKSLGSDGPPVEGALMKGYVDVADAYARQHGLVKQAAAVKRGAVPSAPGVSAP
ncbi:hypothetical protein AQI95_12465 [Streptomyces yokosukanensis]|uniref:Uncharacterized protein n=1 Tax=Streptomyces yokosukanensis TaxID=67386 RepID=A0A101P846_9ACTN|nr:hypothetical protein AQI95_12465 [Streptomyces yokosukanensis]